MQRYNFRSSTFQEARRWYNTTPLGFGFVLQRCFTVGALDENTVCGAIIDSKTKKVGFQVIIHAQFLRKPQYQNDGSINPNLNDNKERNAPPYTTNGKRHARALPGSAHHHDYTRRIRTRHLYPSVQSLPSFPKAHIFPFPYNGKKLDKTSGKGETEV